MKPKFEREDVVKNIETGSVYTILRSYKKNNKTWYEVETKDNNIYIPEKYLIGIGCKNGRDQTRWHI